MASTHTITVNTTSGTVQGVANGYTGGDIVVNVENGASVSDRFYGGSDAHSNTYVSVDGNITVNMNGGSITTQLYGGSNFIGGEFSSYMLKDITINMTGGSVAQIRGGNNISGSIAAALQEQGKTVGVENVTINISGGTITGSLGDAIRGAGGAHSSVLGKVEINISGNANIKNDVYAGARHETSTVNAFVRSTSVNVSGGTINGNVFGGGTYDGVSTTVNGNTSVVISGGTIEGGVYGAGNQDIINGSTSITLEGSNVNIKGVVSGLGKNGTSTVAGNKILNIGSEESGFTSDVAIDNGQFNVISITEDSKVAFKNAIEVDSLTIGNGADITFAETGNSIGELSVVFSDQDFEANTGSIDLATVLGDSTSIVLASLKEGANVVLVDSDGTKFATTSTGETTFDIGATIPEPSTYAMIFGALALGFVAYRRRK